MANCSWAERIVLSDKVAELFTVNEDFFARNGIYKEIRKNYKWRRVIGGRVIRKKTEQFPIFSSSIDKREMRKVWHEFSSDSNFDILKNGLIFNFNAR